MPRGKQPTKPIDKPLLQEACALLGGSSFLAIAIPCSPSYISHLLYNKTPVSQFVANRIEKLTKGKVKSLELRPRPQRGENWKKGERLRDRLGKGKMRHARYEKAIIRAIEHTAGILNPAPENSLS
jgi:DNA-binding transcriptional regulator YdaS (Cro superfamily)